VKTTKPDNCPRCGAALHRPFVALSRRDNKTEICPTCGTYEALTDWALSTKKRETNDNQ
jgi:ribosomal protein S27AE